MATISVSFGDSGTNYTELQDFLDDYNSGTIVTESSSSHTIASTDDIVCSIQTNIDFTPVTASSGTYFNPPTKPNTLTIKGANGFTGGLLSSAETVTMQGPGWLRLGVISGMSGFGYIFEDLRWNCNGYRSNNSNYSMFHAFGSNRGGQLNRVVVDNYTITHATHAGWVFHSDCRSSKYLDLNSVGITNFDGGTGSGARYGFLVSGSSSNNKLEASHCFTYNCNWGSGSGTQYVFHRSNSNATNMNLKGCVSLGNTFGSGTTGVFGTTDTLQDCGSDDSTASTGLQSLTTAQLDNWANPINDLNLDSTSTIKSSARQLAAQNATGTTLTLDLNGDDRSTVDAQDTVDKWSLGAVQYSAASSQSVAAGTASSTSLAVSQAVERAPDVASSSIYILPPIGLSSPAGVATSTASAIGPLSVLSVSVVESTAYIMPPVGLSSPAGVAITQSSVQSPGVSGAVTAGGITTEGSQGSGSFTVYGCLGCEAIGTSAGLGPFLVSFSPSCQATESSAGSGTFVAGDIGQVEIIHTLSPASLAAEAETGPWSIQDIVLSPASSSAEIDVQVQADIEVSLQPLQSSSEASVDEVNISQQLPSLQSAVSATVDVTAQQSPVLPSLQLAVSLQDLASVSTQSSHQLQPVRIAATVFSTINAVSVSQLLPNMGQSLRIAGPAESRHPRVYEVPKISRTLKIRNYDME